MTANLLIHAPHLFCCGISRSGAYNRTLTPFGFQVLLHPHFGTHNLNISFFKCFSHLCNFLGCVQSEERTLWEAPKTYIEMSPFMLADNVKKPILLIHGEEDNNAGTLTMQVNFTSFDSLVNKMKSKIATKCMLPSLKSKAYYWRQF